MKTSYQKVAVMPDHLRALCQKV